MLLALTVPAVVLRGAVELRRAFSGTTLAWAHHAVQQDLVTLAAAQALGFGLAIALGVAIAKRPNLAVRTFLGALPVSAPVLLLACAVGATLPFPLEGLHYLVLRAAPGLVPEVAEQLERWNRLRVEGILDAVTVPLAVVAVPAVVEELFFRGLLLPGLVRRYGRRIGLVGSALLFGLVHLEPVVTLLAAVAGLILGEVRLRTGSVWPSVALHGAFNAVPVLLAPTIVAIPGFNSTGVEPLPWPLLVGGTAVCGGCLFVLLRWPDVDPDL